MLQAQPTHTAEKPAPYKISMVTTVNMNSTEEPLRDVGETFVTFKTWYKREKQRFRPCI